MENRNKFKNYALKFACAALFSALLAGCEDEVDNSYSRNRYNLDISASSQAIVLNESTPDEVALTIEWTPAADYGEDYLTTYMYEVDLIGGTISDSTDEYIDDYNFTVSYTHRQLQELLVDDWNRLTSTTSSVKFSITATQQGPTVVVPEMSSVTIRIKTYGATQFKADKLFMSGSAVGEGQVQLLPSANNANLYVYNGTLAAGNINFPVVYDDEDQVNRICPLIATQTIMDGVMDATVSPASNAGVWVIPEADTYRVTVDFANRTVSIIPADDILEVDRIFLAGTAVGADQVEVAQTLENESIYAWRGELTAGTLWLPVEFGGSTEMSIVPAGSAQAITDGSSIEFKQAETDDAEDSRHWIIPTAGTYRIVVDTELKRITIYSPTTDLQNVVVSYNNTVLGVNPYSQEVTVLWMWGGFNDFKGGMGGNNEFSETYTLKQSVADPRIFVYKGGVLPRVKDGGAMNFKVSSDQNNVYAYSSTVDAVRNQYNGYEPTVLGGTYVMREGQGDNRYAYFQSPANCNYVVVDIGTMKVLFDHKE